MCFDLGNGLLLLLVGGAVVATLGDLPFSSWDGYWLLALLLLGWLLAACPSSPGMFLGLQASSTMVGFVWWCCDENNGVLMSILVWPNGWCIPLAVHFSLAAGSVGRCGAASRTLSQMIELLVSS
jgi:hypothetical protein